MWPVLKWRHSHHGNALSQLIEYYFDHKNTIPLWMWSHKWDGWSLLLLVSLLTFIFFGTQILPIHDYSVNEDFAFHCSLAADPDLYGKYTCQFNVVSGSIESAEVEISSESFILSFYSTDVFISALLLHVQLIVLHWPSKPRFVGYGWFIKPKLLINKGV